MASLFTMEEVQELYSFLETLDLAYVARILAMKAYWL